VDHVLQHLEEPLRLEDVAAVAGVSRFHFHRIFRALMGETLQRFVKRVRLERALSMMSRTPRPRLTDVAFACGFSSSSDFTRSFRQRYGVAPSAFDVRAWRDGRHADVRRAVESMRFSAESPARYHIDPPLSPGQNPDGFQVVLRDLPPRRVAYLRVLDPFQGTAVFDACRRLVAWAEARGLADGQWLGFMWDDPEVAALEDCRYDVGVVIGPLDPTDGVSVLDFPAMRVAEVVIRGDLALETRAMDWLFETWLPASGFLPDDQPGFEAWIGRPFAHGVEHFEVALHLPVLRNRVR
jgi:AraC family transcriptional regulator